MNRVKTFLWLWREWRLPIRLSWSMSGIGEWVLKEDGWHFTIKQQTPQCDFIATKEDLKELESDILVKEVLDDNTCIVQFKSL